MRNRGAVHQFTGTHHLQFSGLFLFIGCLLFCYVWWPIQAERARKESRQWEELLSQKKAELQMLKLKYSQLTTLERLDKWAKAHGPYKIPLVNDIILLEK